MAIENELEEERVNKLNQLEQIEKLEQAVAKLAGNGPLMLNYKYTGGTVRAKPLSAKKIT